MLETKRFYSNGKLLLTGEYVVLDGARALALPTKYGQDLVVESFQSGIVKWQSVDSNGSVWYSDNIQFSEIFEGTSSENNPIRKTLVKILHEAHLLNPEVFKNKDGYSVTTTLTFPKNWGLGTSSTLINNIAQWFGVNAFELLSRSFGGSGYDIAAAQNDCPVIYSKLKSSQQISKVDFDLKFKNNLYFVYLNRKQSSKDAIASYYNNRGEDVDELVNQISRITDSILHASALEEFAQLIERHEKLLSTILQMKTVKELYFSDFKGTIKSLGGWGGDFILVASAEDPTLYFTERGYPVIIPYPEMIL
jgi:mevalonate kinase